MNQTRYFFDANGNFLGGFEGAEALSLIPSNAIEWPNAPDHGLDKLEIDTMSIIPHREIPPLDKSLIGLIKQGQLELIQDPLPVKVRRLVTSLLGEATMAIETNDIDVVEDILLDFQDQLPLHPDFDKITNSQRMIINNLITSFHGVISDHK